MKNTTTELVIYHKNCMDGLGAAACFEVLNNSIEAHSVIFKAVQHGTPDKEQFLNKLTPEQKKCDFLTFVDFSLDAKQIEECTEAFEKVLIIDHHKTSQSDLESEELKNIKNLKMIFDMDKSGAILAWEYVNENLPKDISKDISLEETIPFTLMQYIQDRDLWQWKLSQSREFSESLKFSINQENNKTKDEIKSFLNIAKNTNLVDLIIIGDILLEKTSQMVKAKTEENKLKTVILNGIELLALNATENISEIGNEICLKYNKPALMYFILETGEVVFSLRSTDDLPDVSTIAKSYGGGGHRNACGFSGGLVFLGALLERD